MIRRYLARRRYQRALADAYAERRDRMPWLQLCAAMHHSQHPGETRGDCAGCHPERLIALLDELTPLPTERGGSQ